MDKLIDDIEKNIRFSDFIIRKKGRTMLRKYDITTPQFMALQSIIYHDGEMSIGELSEKMGLACSTVTDLINRMEKSELVIRDRDKKDGRIVRLKVLDKGREIVKDVLNTRREYLKDVLKDLNEEEHVELSENLKTLAEKLRLNSEDLFK